jgi:hypothetical protein
MAAAPAPGLTPVVAAAPLPVGATRFQTADGRVFEEVSAAPAHGAAQPVYKAAPTPVVHRKVVHHTTRHTTNQPHLLAAAVFAAALLRAAAPGALICQRHEPRGHRHRRRGRRRAGNHVGGGNDKKIATVAGVLLGGYAGNEVAQDRNPIAFSGR